MTFIKMISKPILFFSILTVLASCNAQDRKSADTKNEHTAAINMGDTVSEIGKNIRCIFQDSKNNFWFATDGEGVFKYDGKTFTQFTDKHGLCSKFVWFGHERKDKTLWFETRDGLCSFDGKQFSTIRADENRTAATDLHDADILVDYSYDGTSVKKFLLPQTSPLTNDNNYYAPYAVYCSYKDSKGNLWFGTDSRGVCKYDGTSYAWINDRELGVAVRSICEDKKGDIWIGNNGFGLFRYDGKSLTNFTREHKLENPDFLKKLKGKEGTLARVWTITDDKHANLWVGTIDAGLWKYDGKVLTNYTTKDGLTSNSIWTVYCDNNGSLWIGTDGNGITIYDGKTFTAFRGQK